MKARGDYTRCGKTLLAAAMMSVFLLLLAAPPPAEADGRSNCQRNMERGEARLQDAIHRYGGNSKIAIQRYRELNAERERCWNLYHSWWGVNDHRWHTERDWERYDGERGWHY